MSSAHSSSGIDKPTASRAARSQQSVWGSSRGIAPLSTDLSTSSANGSPLTSTFSAVLTSSSRLPNNRNIPSPASTPASFPSLQQAGGQQQQHSAQTISSPKPRALTPSSASHLATSTASGGGSGGGGGGGGGGIGGAGISRSAAFSPVLTGTPTGFPSDKPGSATASGANLGQSSLSKISVAQIFLLLDSINEKEGKEKWETKAAQIHKLVDSNGMEVFSKYFRRLLSGNAPQIFPGVNKMVENAGNYPLLVQEVQKVSQDPDQAQKIADTVDTSDSDIFRDFDLSTFLDHFKLDPIAKVALTLAFKNVSKADLRTKADAILTNSIPQFLHSLSIISETNKDFTTSFIGLTLERFILHPPRNFDDDIKQKLVYASRARYQSSEMDIPPEIESAMQMFGLSDPQLSLVRQIQVRGPKAMSTRESIVETINSVGPNGWSEDQIACALLYIIISQNWRQFSPELLLTTVQNHQSGETFNWSTFLRSFDRGGLLIDASQFARLFNSLISACHDNPAIDTQLLWSGEWENRDTQLSFLTAALSSNIDITRIPNFRSTFPLDIFNDASDTVRQQAEQAQRSLLRSFDAVKAIFDLILKTPGTWSLPDSQRFVKNVLQHDLPIFLCSAFAIPQPWSPVQINFVVRSFSIFLSKRQDGYQFALHGVWKLDRTWVVEQLYSAFTQDPSCTELVYEHAVEHGWLDHMLEYTSGLSMDLAALAHRKADYDLEQWVKNTAQKAQIDMGTLLSKFLRIKAEDELSIQRNEHPTPHMVTLSVKTVYTLLQILEDYIADHETLTPIQRICLQTYPRLINYGEGFDDIIEANGAHGNSIPEEIDKQMQDLFGKMYHEELSLREILERMRKYKTSRDPAEQDLFTCMVHGLVDEYNCYHTYPLEALTKTAVMFGGIINFRLISGIPLKVGLGMILDAVREHEPHQPMYKFGVEAIEQLIGRLPEWAGFCNLLLHIPSLQGTPIYRRAEEVLREQGHHPISETDGAEMNGLSEGMAMTNGINELLAVDNAPHNFKSLHVDPLPEPNIYREPNEEVHDKILFILNNVSEQNIEGKLKDLKDVLQAEHHQWFASYLVEERAKLQPNFQQLYLDLLDLIGDKTLWAEVLRETYVSAIRLLNAESTMNSATERTHLKNLGGWLGSLTIAKDKPIKHRNIYFKDLLIEAFDSQRLMVVIPFTCKVLVQAMKSTIFKPPNPWLMDILSLLMEIYHFAELKMILKFEIEVLCGDLELDYKIIEPSTCIRERPAQVEDSIPPANIPEGLESFADMSRAIQNERLSPAAIFSSLPNLPNLDQILVLPPANSAMPDPNVIRRIVHGAVERAIAEIIAPVVERSITIASISTAQLILKDFAMEPDEEKVRQAARTMVRSLAGSLALVTCKEPLKMSMTNYIRMLQQDQSEQPMPEGLVIICVNDNLDAACGIVEKAAEEKSLPEIEKVIESQLEARRRHRASRPNEPFIDPSISRWGFFIPEPYKQVPGGLNKEQLAIYEGFARQSRGTGQSHIQNASTDSGKQIPDVLQESFPSIPNLSTPAEQPAVPHHVSQPQQESAMHQPAIAAAQPQINGFGDTREKVENLVSQLQLVARNTSEQHLKDLGRDTPLFQEYNQVMRTLLSSPNNEDLARLVALKVCSILYSHPESSLEIELLVHLLAKICGLSSVVARYTWIVLSELDDEHMLEVPVTVALIDAGLMDLHRVDMILTKLIQEKNVAALGLLSDFIDRLLLNDEPSALRSDFSGSLDAMNKWVVEDSELPVANDIIRKLRESGIPEVVNPLLNDQARTKRDQMEYIFTEWIGVYKYPNANDRTYSTFLKDMHQRQVMNNQEDSALFFRLSIDISVAMFEHECQNPAGSLDEAFLYIDALAKLVILLVKFQGESNGAVKASKPVYLNSILSLLVLVLNHHQVMRGESFNQRVFFRLFSSILCEYSMSGLQRTEQHKDMMGIFADRFLSLQPKHAPGFVYGWLALISHRVFMAGMLNVEDQSGWESFCEIMQVLLSYIGEQLKPANVSFVAKDIYKGVLRILLILHHDFPEFVAENHYRFCNVIPSHCAQLRNLVLSAYPSSFQKLPDPFREGLKVDRLDEIRKAPKIAGDIAAPLQRANLTSVVDNAFRGPASDAAIHQICEAISNPPAKDAGLFFAQINVDVVLLNSLILYIGQSAVASPNQKGGAVTFNNSPQTALLEKLSKYLQPEARYYFLSAIANQLRYPNSHTHYFSYIILHLFGSAEQADQQGSDIREQIIRVLLERLIVHRPHPWGLIITLQELLQNGSYTFFRLPFIQATPEIGRLFDALLQHIQQQSPRAA